MHDNIQISEAENGTELINLLEQKNQELALIVLDMNMPEMNGLETIEEIKSLAPPDPGNAHRNAFDLL